MARGALSPELSLLLACCRWPVAPDAVRAAAQGPVDWRAFRNLLDRHGVVALASHALGAAHLQLPPEHAEPLRQAVAAQTRRSLYLAGETARWAQRFAQGGIACRFLKGASLAQLAYGDLALKRSSDVDVLVSPDQVLAACALLTTAGFAPVKPYDVDSASLARYWRWGKEVTYVDDRGVLVDLHVRLAENRRVLQGFDVLAPRQDVDIGSVAVPTFSDRMTYAYLCYHGAAHGWSRVKWLADLNAFLAGRDLASLHAAAERQGLGTASHVALQLCRNLLGRGSSDEPAPSSSARLHARVALAGIRHPVGGSDIKGLSALGLATSLSQATIAGRFRSFLGAVHAQWMQPCVRARYPDRYAMIFHLLRLPRLVAALPRKIGSGS